MRWSLAFVVWIMACGGRDGDRDLAELARAAGTGDAVRIAALLASGEDPDAAGRRGVTALHLAARENQVSAIRALVDGRADIDLVDARNHWTPLMHAIHKVSEQAAVMLLDAGADIEARAGSGATALFMAAGYGHERIVRELLDRRADPYAECDDGTNALWAAAGGGAIVDFMDGPPFGTCFPQIIELLLEAGPDATLPSGLATTAVAWFASSETCSRLVDELPRE